ncbi:hypothetical protein EUX98_g7569 [Antrodiella citrinella]|uniref:Redoxin domain-containing protein n=1 Tax=Antrodiella citrinella TaxID=2447956 RepID=A0A4S4MLR1_9APHY|nr:hypothetical protein EUX98_g7569 [Antrodiella citrinella]
MSLPDAKTIEEASKLNVLDSDGKPLTFGSLIQDNEVIVAYVTTLATVRPEALEKANKKLIIIGCGTWQPIKAYVERSGFKGPIYADPTRGLFNLFGTISSLESTPKGEQKKSYAPTSYFYNAVGSIWARLFNSFSAGLQHPQHVGKQGSISQLGGEFILGKDGQCTFAARMKHTEDHTEVADLMREAGVEYP